MNKQARKQVSLLTDLGLIRNNLSSDFKENTFCFAFADCSLHIKPLVSFY